MPCSGYVLVGGLEVSSSLICFVWFKGFESHTRKRLLYLLPRLRPRCTHKPVVTASILSNYGKRMPARKVIREMRIGVYISRPPNLVTTFLHLLTLLHHHTREINPKKFRPRPITKNKKLSA